MGLTELAAVLEAEMATTGGTPQQGEPPADSIEGAVLKLLHGLVDGITSSVPKTMQLSSQVNRSMRPIQIELRGRNSQGLNSRLVVRVDLDGGVQGIRADVVLMLFNAQGVPVANPSKSFAVRRTDSVREIVKQFGAWVTQAEQLQMAPVGAGGRPVLL